MRGSEVEDAPTTSGAGSTPQDTVAGEAHAPEDGSGSAWRRARRWVEPVGLFVLAALPLIWQMGLLLPDMPWGRPASSDHAALELDIRSAVLHGTGVGGFSRLGVRNIGPFHAYWSAPWYWLTDQGLGGMVVACWALHASAIAIVLVTIDRLLGRRATWLAAMALCLGWLRAGPFALSDPYNPAYTVSLVLVTVVAGVACVNGRWWFLPIAVGAASACVFTHLTGAPGLLVVLAAVLVLGLMRTRPEAKHIVATIAVAGVLWMPTAIDQVAGTHNFSSLVSATARGPDVADQPFGRPGPSGPRLARAQTALQLGALTSPDSAAQGTLQGTAWGRPGMPTAPRTAIAVIVLGTMAGAAWWGRKRSPEGALLIGLSLAGTAVTWLATANLERGFIAYYHSPIVGYALASLVGLFIIVGQSWSYRTLGAAAGATAVGAGLVLGANGTYGLLNVFEVPEPDDQIAFTELVRQQLPEECDGGALALEGDAMQVADVWIVMNELEKQGFTTTLPDDVGEVFTGPGHRRTGTEVARVVIPTLEQMRTRELPPNAVEILGC